MQGLDYRLQLNPCLQAMQGLATDESMYTTNAQPDIAQSKTMKKIKETIQTCGLLLIVCVYR